MSRAYYNEFDEQAAAWLRELINQGHIAPGDVDTRSIEDVKPDDLRGYTQCHFFAGIGVWSYALRRAGWPDDRPIWTGSCPCQPFSAAGKGAAFDDERHLWPAFHHLIKVGRPAIVLGEQVASSVVDDWIDLVHADVEALGYAFGSVPFPSAGVGAPHIRDRNYWVAHARSGSDRTQKQAADNWESKANRSANKPGGRSVSPGGMDHADHQGPQGYGRSEATRGGPEYGVRFASGPAGAPSSSGWLADAPGIGRDQGRPGESSAERDGLAGNGGAAALRSSGVADASSTGRRSERAHGDAGNVHEADSARPTQSGRDGADHPAGPTNGYWRDADWLGCRDGKWRPVEPGTFPLANGAAARVVRLRGYGNAINAEAAQAWIETVMECVA